MSAAVAARNAIAGLEVLCYHVEVGNPGMDALDNTGRTAKSGFGGPFVPDGLALVLNGLPTYLKRPFLRCGSAVLEPLSGRIRQAATFVDSGLGPVAIEPDRTVVERSGDIVLREATPAGRWEMRALLHALRGQDQPAWVAVNAIPILASTVASVEIPMARPSPSDWTATHIAFSGEARQVLTAVQVGLDRHQLSFTELAAPPTGRMLVLREVRGLSDEVEIDHYRGHWATAKLTLGTA